MVHDPTGFGRILRDSAGRFLRIVEERDCTPEEKAIREVNPSCYVFELPGLWDALDQIGTSNAQGEYYLTDAPERLMAMGRKVMALNVLRARRHPRRQHPPAPRPGRTAIMQARIQDHWMTEGVTIVDPRNTYIDGRATIGRDTVIYPFTVITGAVQDRRRLPGRTVHPPARRHVLDDGVEVGAFVEVSRSHLETGTIARHLAYLGNASVGRDVNIGAGAITANFDGTRKNETRIGDRALIGSGAIMVAPVTIGHRRRRRRRRGDHPGQARRRRRDGRRRSRPVAGGPATRGCIALKRPGRRGRSQDGRRSRASGMGREGGRGTSPRPRSRPGCPAAGSEMTLSAITAAVLAVLAAIGSLLSGHAVNQAILAQTKATDQWAYYQAKSTKQQLYEVGGKLIEAPRSRRTTARRCSRHRISEAVPGRATIRYDREKEDIKKEAEHLEAESRHEFHKHHQFALGIACFQVGIVLASVSILVRLRAIYYLSLLAGLAGLAWVMIGLVG